MLETAFFWFSICLGPLVLAAWLIFARLSMARIEKDLMADGQSRPAPWDRSGGRVIWYAYAIALPLGPWNPEDDPLINVKLVRHYANRSDKVRAWALCVLVNLLLVVIVIGGPILGLF